MATLFQRRCAVVVDGLRIEGLRTQFRAEKNSGKQPNSLDLSITNLSATSRASMQKKGSIIQLEAGYQDETALIFVGNARLIDHKRESADWVTRVLCGDGEEAYSSRWVSESFGPGVRTLDLIKRLVAIMGLDSGNLLEAAAEAAGKAGKPSSWANGYVLEGRASAELDKLMRGLGLRWSIQDGAFFVQQEQVRTIFELTPESGLIGSPEQGSPETSTRGGKTRNILKATVLLHPSLRIGSLVSIRSAQQRGLFRLEKLTHRGDTAGGDWFTEFEAAPSGGAELA